jgi:hypothetical protein
MQDNPNQLRGSHIYILFGVQYYDIPLTDSVVVYRDAIREVAKRKNYIDDHVPYFRLYETHSSCTAIPSTDSIPDMKVPCVIGSTYSTSLIARLYDKMEFEISNRVVSVSMVGCRFYCDIAFRLIAKEGLHASCLEQLSFSRHNGRRIVFTERLPDPVLQSKQPPIKVTCMVKVILLEVLDDVRQRTGRFEEMRVISDRDMTRRTGEWGLLPVDNDGNVVERDPPVVQLHLLHDSGRYCAAARRSHELCENYRTHDSKIQEEEVRRAVLSYAFSSGVKLRVLPTVIMNDKDTVFQEWDGAFYDERKRILYLTETKHKMTVEHVNEVHKRLGLINTFLASKKTSSTEYRKLDISKNVIILATGLFDPKVLAKAKQYKFATFSVSSTRYAPEGPSPFDL